jgi:hypothetical protein
MLTYISGWRSPDRDQALIRHRDQNRSAVFFIDDASKFPELLPDAPIIELYRNGLVDFPPPDAHETLIRLNYDTENDLLRRAITHSLMVGMDAQIIVTYDAVTHLYRLIPALRAAGALVAANERLDAPAGDRVLFTRGGSFVWIDHLLETQTSQLFDAEVLDGGIIPEDADGLVTYSR